MSLIYCRIHRCRQRCRIESGAVGAHISLGPHRLNVDKRVGDGTHARTRTHTHTIPQSEHFTKRPPTASTKRAEMERRTRTGVVKQSHTNRLAAAVLFHVGFSRAVSLTRVQTLRVAQTHRSNNKLRMHRTESYPRVRACGVQKQILPKRTSQASTQGTCSLPKLIRIGLPCARLSQL